MSTAVPQSEASSAFGTKSNPTYEFTKRKRWADLLLTELVDDVAFVLSPTCNVLFCGTTITELLGWRDIDLLDVNFMELMDTADQTRFRVAFDDSARTNAEFNLLVRMKSNDSALSYGNISPPKAILFDIKCYPHVVVEGEVETKCFFAMAAPYPSRNTAMLDTILDLKVENDRLQRKVTEYRNRLPGNVSIPGQTSSSQGNSMYATSSLHPPRHIPSSGGILQKGPDASNQYLTSSNIASGQFADMMPSSKEQMDFSDATLYGPTLNGIEEQVDEGSKKKKLKRAQTAEQYVCITCGRTDSPEWRKGPLGPKTLCNACGLRWAKQMRKVEEPTGTNGSSSNVPET